MTSVGTPALIVNGLVSGITTQAVIGALLQSYQDPITNLTNQQSTLDQNAGDYRQISTDLQAMLNAAGALNETSAWNLASATSSDQAVATAVASPGAKTGSLTFTVDQLAQANVLASKSGVASTTSVVTTASSTLLATGATALGLDTLAAGAGLPLGSWAMAVTQASAAGAVTGSAPFAATTTITTANDSLTLTVNGSLYHLTLKAGTYTPTGLVAAVGTAASAAGAPIAASLTSTGALEVATAAQGGSATVTVSGGSALTSLRLVSGQSGTGVSAVVTFGGTKTTLTLLTAGGAVTLHAPGTSTVTATVSKNRNANGSLVAAGSAHVAHVSTGNGSLDQVVSEINASGLAVTASAVKTSAGDYVLQIVANDTGTANALSVTSTAFSSSVLGGLQTIQAAQTATVTVGTTGGYQVTSGSDTFTNLLAGTTVKVVSTGQTTVTVSPDATAEAAKVTALVKAANAVLADIQKYAGYTTSKKTGGPLMGSVALADIRSRVLSVFATVAGSSSLGNLSDAGVTVTKAGTLSFTTSKFVTAFDTNPQAVTDLFAQGGTFHAAASTDTGAVSFAFAGTATPAGTYAVDVTHSATQATDLGATLSTGKVTTAEMLSITMNGATATYTTAAGESLTQVASGLDSAFAQAGISISARVAAGTQLELVSGAYGSSATFSVRSTATGAGTTGLAGSTATTAVVFSGTDVAGTIGGVAAIGNGQVLTAPDGLGVVVTASGITSTTTLGTLTYRPGAAQLLSEIANGATNPENGSISVAIKSLTGEATGLSSQISMYEQMKASEHAVLVKEFANMETTLGQLKSESSQLASAIAQLP
ncbi:MAG: flagellar filament capping protein FliD [Acidimicrobiales bacterium]